jgi:hypothetical protein
MGSGVKRLNATAVISKGHFKNYLIRYSVFWNLINVSNHDKLFLAMDTNPFGLAEGRVLGSGFAMVCALRFLSFQEL